MSESEVSMKGTYIFTGLILLLLVSGTQLQAQSQGGEYRWAAGLLGGATIAVTEGNEVNPSFVGLRAHLRYALAESIILELGGGFLPYEDRHDSLPRFDAAGTVIPVDLRLMLSPWASSDFSPYAFAGFGASFYSIDTAETPEARRDGVESSGNYMHIPLGLGATYSLSPNFAIDVWWYDPDVVSGALEGDVRGL